LASLVNKILLAARKRTWPSASPEGWLRGAATVANAILVIALARALAGLTATILWGQSALPISATAATAQGLGGGETKIAQPTDVSNITAWHLFGRMEAAPVVEAQPAPIAVSPLNLRLVGIFLIERRADKALALIAEGTSMERSYRIGESLPGGARLEQIQRNSVIVSRDGQQEVINLPRLEEAGRKPASGAMPAAMPAEPEMPMPAEPEMPVPMEPEMPVPMPPQSAIDPLPQQQAMVDATTVASRLRGAEDRPRALEDIAFASPYIQNGQFLGFRLRPGRDRQLMRELGLNSGDVITEVNGSRLNNPIQGFAALREVMDADQINVRVLRNGAEIPLAFSLGGTASK